MKELLHFEFSRFYKNIWFYTALLLVITFGIFTGANTSFNPSVNIYKNSTYTISYAIGFLSLLCIFFATLLTTQIVFKEKDNNFNLIFYALPIKKTDYLLSRFIVVFAVNSLLFVLFIAGFAVGQISESNNTQFTDFRITVYLLPAIVFGLVNSLFCSALLCSIAWLSQNKLMVYVAGILLYIAYLLMLIFSGSPLMSRGFPQSEELVLFSAIFDPFGLSAFLFQTSKWTVEQRNYQLIIPSNVFLYNRVGVIIFSLLTLALSVKFFSFGTKEKRRNKNIQTIDETRVRSSIINPIIPSISWKRHIYSLLSVAKIDLKYLVKSIPFVIICLSFLFYLSMEMYGDIEKGVRLPQKYVTSGLMASTIIDEFHTLCLIMLIYYAQDIFWRSRISNFHLIEAATPLSSTVNFFSKWLTLSVIIFFFTTLMIFLGIIFQFVYQYYSINWNAYLGVYLFVCVPLIITSGVILLVQKVINQRFIGLAASAMIVLFMATSVGNSFLTHPILRFQMPISVKYSDMNGYGSYLSYFSLLYFFGTILVLLSAIIVTQFKDLRVKNLPLLATIILSITTTFVGYKLSENHKPLNRDLALAANADYETQFRKFQNLPQPIITDVQAKVDLLPEKNAYTIEGEYILRNKSEQEIESVLVNFADDFQIIEAELNGKQISDQYSVINFNTPLKPNETAKMRFKIYYEWKAVNGHQSFNAIVENGTFLRISRYFPQIGYLEENEIQSEQDRNKFQLGEATAGKKIDAPRNKIDDFINLEMTISTSSNQTAIGIGELVREWKLADRNYFQYRTDSPIPFRFAVSSAQYAVEKVEYQGKSIEIYYHPIHSQNVSRLLENIKVTLDYCQSNFGPYPFKTIRFAEISGFTRGFVGTAYPTSIFMTENTLFDANINADPKRDVINELAGHELSHLWWGNSQINPDEREGSAMLTETLAMYSELMIAKQIYGKEGMMRSVNLYKRMYLDERGFTEEQPLYRLLPENIHLSYYKGAVAMYQLSQIIGEENLNLALRNFLRNYTYPKQKPITTDLIKEFYQVTDKSLHPKIDDLFMKITTFDFEIVSQNFTKTGQGGELEFTFKANKYYEDGKGSRMLVPFNDYIELEFVLENGQIVEKRLFIEGNYLQAKLPFVQSVKEIKIDQKLKFIEVKE